MKPGILTYKQDNQTLRAAVGGGYVEATGTHVRLITEFFVKQGDGAADLKPIAHLYKSQVYQLAEYLCVPKEICRRTPTTDTYSLEQSQSEFYFGLSLEQTDLCLYAKEHNLPIDAAAEATGLTIEQVTRAYQVIDAKRRAARYLHTPAVLFEAEPA